MAHINYDRLASLTAGAIVTSTSLMIALKLGSIPSAIFSLIGLGGLAGFACGLAGAGGGIFLYLEASRKLSLWPMDKENNEPNQTTFLKFFNNAKPEDESAYEEYKAGLSKIEQELKSWTNLEQRQQLSQDFSDAKASLHAFINSRKKTESTEDKDPKQDLSLPITIAKTIDKLSPV